jgi:hypothetical protein
VKKSLMTKEERAVLMAAVEVAENWGVYDRRYLPPSMRHLYAAVDALLKSERPKRSPSPRGRADDD